MIRLDVSIVSSWGIGNRCLKQNGSAGKEARATAQESTKATSGATAEADDCHRRKIPNRLFSCHMGLTHRFPMPHYVIVKMRVEEAVGTSCVIIDLLLRM